MSPLPAMTDMLNQAAAQFLTVLILYVIFLCIFNRTSLEVINFLIQISLIFHAFYGGGHQHATQWFFGKWNYFYICVWNNCGKNTLPARRKNTITTYINNNIININNKNNNRSTPILIIFNPTALLIGNLPLLLVVKIKDFAWTCRKRAKYSSKRCKNVIGWKSTISIATLI